MTDIMYEIPSNENIEKCIVTKDTIEKNEQPLTIINGNVKPIKKKSLKQPSEVATEDETA
jgi:ATP-dependent Clp protease ATP-binding subunit ClpX